MPTKKRKADEALSLLGGYGTGSDEEEEEEEEE
eukprot:CAMPEP_0197586340 /NCGR_PEP_ID=MMETSP1326-20131121/8340_1 /TAXON_ID=1155430 /ORGANISM="Genus nov. species nov., Strain RCC2288" /LENGTH=32 /DNA_ID= /DNA_START= /DNA_END= /DNA_ORIENTATION=